ncbi:MAG TPA: addiction module protein [Polyangia bacterium]|jgi:hypothetical protein
MTGDESEIERAALELEPRSRAKLAERLLASLDSLSEAEIQALWAEEAERRDAELEAGAEAARPAADVFRDARARLK